MVVRIQRSSAQSGPWLAAIALRTVVPAAVQLWRRAPGVFVRLAGVSREGQQDVGLGEARDLLGRVQHSVEAVLL